MVDDMHDPMVLLIIRGVVPENWEIPGPQGFLTGGLTCLAPVLRLFYYAPPGMSRRFSQGL